jgi:hypothetical protein
MAEIDVRQLWTYVTQQVKNEIVMPSLWRALEAAVPITVDGEELVIGFGGSGGEHVGQLLSNQNRLKIEAILANATRLRLRIRVIEGSTMADWQQAKQSDAEASRMQAQNIKKHQETVAAGTTWDAVGEQVVRKFGSMPNRSLTGVQGRFLIEAVAILAEGYGRLMPEEPSEQDERAYGRTLERVAERSGVPGAMIAYLVLQKLGKAS